MAHWQVGKVSRDGALRLASMRCGWLLPRAGGLEGAAVLLQAAALLGSQHSRPLRRKPVIPQPRSLNALPSQNRSMKSSSHLPCLMASASGSS